MTRLVEVQQLIRQLLPAPEQYPDQELERVANLVTGASSISRTPRPATRDDLLWILRQSLG